MYGAAAAWALCGAAMPAPTAVAQMAAARAVRRMMAGGNIDGLLVSVALPGAAPLDGQTFADAPLRAL